ncbi:uncharacterized protein APUU_60421S [Aspergillus puulaauensis]|uniref:MYND-type domain-containing protein n=1 Tax=Aspergillus puulaauensis TaxID=1220207 RepID=A0A7R7XV03_9EURO|nr:uncharacterized protein APUU_60421S [Aspergillus puulaauensis]BCS27373.1 hypothetical protein APUU_60421S [Aspergillus puulaauensis]
MSDIVCAVCETKESSETTFMCCSRCTNQYYCSWECLEQNWENHQNVCWGDANSSSHPPSKSLAASIHSPGPKSPSRILLYYRSEDEAYEIIIDAYRLYRDTRSTSTRQADPNDVFRVVPDSRDDFRQFLNLAESRPDLLPRWWSSQKTNACLYKGSGEGWSSLAARVDYLGIIKHYGNPTIPPHLWDMAKVVYGDLWRSITGWPERSKGLEERFKDLEERLNRLEERLKGLKERFKGLKELSDMEGRFKNLVL